MTGLTESGRKALLIAYGLAMVGLIVGLDFAVFRHRFAARLMANIAIVGLFGTVYFSLLRRR